MHGSAGLRGARGDLPGDQLVGLAIIDRVGRRGLTLIMVPGAAVSLFVLGNLFVTGSSGPESVPLIVASLVVFMLSTRATYS